MTEIASERHRPEVFRLFRPGDVYLPAMYFVQSFINDSLEDRVAPRLLWDEDGKPRIYDVPKGLIGALWIQFAQAVEDDKRFRSCLTCEKFFEIPRRGGQSAKMYCSARCKMKAYREQPTLEWSAGHWTCIARIKEQSDTLIKASLSLITKPTVVDVGESAPLGQTISPMEVSAENMDDLRCKCEVIIVQRTGETAKLIPGEIVGGGPMFEGR
jgi:hypothetical protein